MDNSLQIIPSKQIVRGKKLGEGGFGIVFQGTWNYHQVAIKTLRLAKLTKELDEEFTREATIMAKLKHSCIIRLYGISKGFEACAMVMEFMPGGDLYHLLADKDKLLPWNSTRWQIAIDIGSGLSYLHEQKVLHRDLKSLNVLLDKGFRAKITDFGLSRIKLESRTVYTKSKAGSVPWMAPELFDRGIKLTAAADVYAYGMVLWEIAARKVPFSDASHPDIVPTWIQKGEREEIPEDCPKGIAEIIEGCWYQNPLNRPTAKEVLNKLELVRPMPPKKSESIDSLYRLGELSSSVSASVWQFVKRSLSKSKVPSKKTESSKGTLDKIGQEGLSVRQDLEKIKQLKLAAEKERIRAQKAKLAAQIEREKLELELERQRRREKIKEPKWQVDQWRRLPATCVKILTGHTKRVNVLEVLQGQCLASGSNDGTIRIWDVGKKDSCRAILKGHKGIVKVLKSFSLHTQELLVSGGSDRVIRIWKLTKSLQRCLYKLKHSDTIQALEVDDKGFLISGSSDCELKTWDSLAKFKLVDSWNVKDKQGWVLQNLGKNQFATAADFSITVYRGKDSKRFLEGHKHRVNVLQRLPNGHLASGSWDKTVKIWNLTDKQGCVKTIRGFGAMPNALSVLQGKYLVVAVAQSVAFFDLGRDYKPIGAVKAHKSTVTDVKGLPNGRLATASEDKTIKIWDIDLRR